MQTVGVYVNSLLTKQAIKTRMKLLMCFGAIYVND